MSHSCLAFCLFLFFALYAGVMPQQCLSLSHTPAVPEGEGHGSELAPPHTQLHRGNEEHLDLNGLAEGHKVLSY